MVGECLRVLLVHGVLEVVQTVWDPHTLLVVEVVVADPGSDGQVPLGLE